jgi:hypothetical protein
MSNMTDIVERARNRNVPTDGWSWWTNWPTRSNGCALRSVRSVHARSGALNADNTSPIRRQSFVRVVKLTQSISDDERCTRARSGCC